LRRGLPLHLLHTRCRRLRTRSHRDRSGCREGPSPCGSDRLLGRRLRGRSARGGARILRRHEAALDDVVDHGPCLADRVRRHCRRPRVGAKQTDEAPVHRDWRRIRYRGSFGIRGRVPAGRSRDGLPTARRGRPLTHSRFQNLECRLASPQSAWRGTNAWRTGARNGRRPTERRQASIRARAGARPGTPGPCSARRPTVPRRQ
jgi:hypothetical protein